MNTNSIMKYTGIQDNLRVYKLGITIWLD